MAVKYRYFDILCLVARSCSPTASRESAWTLGALMRFRTVTAGSAVAVLAAATLALGAQPASAATGTRPSGSTAPTISAAPPTVNVNNVNAHLQQLQTFAGSNGGNRATGTAGPPAT